MTAFGFVVEGDFFVLPDGASFDGDVAAAVTEAIANLQDAEAEERKAELAASRRKYEDEKKERERLAALAKADQAERRADAAYRVQAASVARSPGQAGGGGGGSGGGCGSGGKMTTYKDLGIDLNARRGG